MEQKDNSCLTNTTMNTSSNQPNISRNYSPISESQNNNQKKGVSPTRFWRWCDEYDFYSSSFLTIAKGNFGEVKRAKFKETVRVKLYANQFAALKYPIGKVHDFTKQFNSLSHEVSCTLILHPSLVNYIGGLYLGNGTPENPYRVGVVMEFISSNLRNAIEKDIRFRDIKIQLNVSKQIASGMNFLHSLNPYILHRDLRSPNILVTSNLECKIADFGMADNMGYENMKCEELYTSLIPPECKGMNLPFTNKGDVYFYGWVLVELALGRKPETGYQLDETLALLDKEVHVGSLKELISRCLKEFPENRPSFQDICYILNSLLDNKLDIELIGQLKYPISQIIQLPEEAIFLEYCDSLGRKLVHQYCIYGNLEGLKELVILKGQKCLQEVDNYNTTCAHFAARNGYLDILQFLHANGFEKFNIKELRFETTPMTLSIAMKHLHCVKFLLQFANLDSLNNGLLSACQEGNLDLVKLFIEHGADVQTCDSELTFTPLCWASRTGHYEIVKYLIEKGANVHLGRISEGTSPLYMACQEGHRDIVELLIEHGADILKPTNDDGTTPIFIASQRRHKEVVELLIKKGADVNKARTSDTCTPLFIASQKGFKEITYLLLQNNADPNIHMSNSNSPLIIASYKGHIEVVQLLVKYGAKISHQGFHSETALDKARNQGHQNIVEYLENL